MRVPSSSVSVALWHVVPGRGSLRARGTASSGMAKAATNAGNGARRLAGRRCTARARYGALAVTSCSATRQMYSTNASMLLTGLLEACWRCAFSPTDPCSGPGPVPKSQSHPVSPS
eukprot:6251958-Prymnesium_polylepis.2